MGHLRALLRPTQRAGARSTATLWIAAASLGVALAPAVALAATYYVRADGSDANSGLGNSPTAAWRTIGKANAVLQGGDVVNVVSLNPADTSSTTANLINPANSGNGAAAGAGLIRYVGNVASPTGLPVPRITITKSWIRVEGFRSKNGARLGGVATAPVHTSIRNCVLNETNSGSGSVEVMGAQYCSLISNSMTLSPPNSQSASLTTGGRDGNYLQPWAAWDTLGSNTIVFTRVWADNRAMWIRGFTNNCVFERNNVKFTCDANGSALQGTGVCLGIYESFGNYYHDNKWQFDAVSNVQNGGHWFGIAVRSGTHHNLFERDTVYSHLNSPSNVMGIDVLFSEGNALPDSTSGIQVHDNHWNACLFKTSSGMIEFYDRMSNCTVENSVFINNSGPALWIQDMMSSTIVHNTFYSQPNEGLHIHKSVTGTNLVQANIFVSGSAAACSQATEFWPASSPFTQNYNVFYSGTGASGAAVRAGGSCYSVGSGSSWCTGSGHDCGSLWGDPRFANATFANFDPTLGTGSAAVNASFPGGYAGARFPAGPDVVPPAPVTDLRADFVSDQNAVLTWTAPGDDGGFGTAVAYDMRWSNSPIDNSNFASATPVAVQPIPAAGGTSQSYVALGLTPGTAYYFAIKTRDEMSNWSLLGNVLAVTTPLTDPVPPAAVRDLNSGP
jgi:hypothetical protein